MLKLQNFFLIMQKVLHEAAKTNFCSLESPGLGSSRLLTQYTFQFARSFQLGFSTDLSTYHVGYIYPTKKSKSKCRLILEKGDYGLLTLKVTFCDKLDRAENMMLFSGKTGIVTG